MPKCSEARSTVTLASLLGRNDDTCQWRVRCLSRVSSGLETWMWNTQRGRRMDCVRLPIYVDICEDCRDLAGKTTQCWYSTGPQRSTTSLDGVSCCRVRVRDLVGRTVPTLSLVARTVPHRLSLPALESGATGAYCIPRCMHFPPCRCRQRAGREKGPDRSSHEDPRGVRSLPRAPIIVNHRSHFDHPAWDSCQIPSAQAWQGFRISIHA